MMQGFEWHVPADQQHWKRLQKALPSLRDIGVDNIWIPPGCKGMDASGIGYDLYDLWDLGEFHQKGSRATRWGPKEDLLELVQTARDFGIGICWDTILNHKAGADTTETFQATKVDPEGICAYLMEMSKKDQTSLILPDRTVAISPPEDISGWVGFDFSGRKGKYSSMRYHHQHFNGVDWDDKRQENGIYKTVGARKDWAKDVSDEHGNYDYLMFANLDHTHPEVRADIFQWSEWIGTELPITGMRIDAAKHYSVAFQRDFVYHLRRTVGANYFLVGEYWRGEVDLLLKYLKAMNHEVSLFDVPLLGRFAVTSQTKGADLRKLFKGTLLEQSPSHAVTFVGNHDTQPGQSLETIIIPFFKPIAYGLILLRSQGQPCVFYGDLYGLRSGPAHVSSPACSGKLPILMQARKLYAYGEQRDYFDKRHCIGFVRYGNVQYPWGLACIISNTVATYKRMYVGVKHRGEEWTDILDWCIETVIIDHRGYGIFPVAAMSISVWVNSKAKGRKRLARPFDTNIYDL
ncbi:Glycoside hydrolase superfamily [Penicillium verhagenii]|nr:Glycoside hydrolase superfamily [Penicillium verhagenii]